MTRRQKACAANHTRRGGSSIALDFVPRPASAHDRASVEADCRAWWPKVRPGGTLAGHDYNQPQVRAGVADASMKGADLTSRGTSFLALKR